MNGSNGPGSDDRAPLILLVQGDQSQRSLYAEAMDGWGFRVAEASDARSGLRSAWEMTPDVIAVDIAGLGSEGSQFLRGLWGVPATTGIPLIRFCEAVPDPVSDDPHERAVVLAPGCLPEQLLDAVMEILAVDVPPSPGRPPRRRPRLPQIVEPYARPKVDRRRDTDA
jgi:CheY-like chemotaxis protein